MSNNNPATSHTLTEIGRLLATRGADNDTEILDKVTRALAREDHTDRLTLDDRGALARMAGWVKGEMANEGQIAMGMAGAAFKALTARLDDAPTEDQVVPRSLIYAGAFYALGDWAAEMATEAPIEVQGDPAEARIRLLQLVEEARQRVREALQRQDASAIFRALEWVK